MAAPNTFERISLEISEASEEMILFALKRLRIMQNKLINNPSVNIDQRREFKRLQEEFAKYVKEAREWTDKELAESYLRGIKRAGKGNVVSGFNSIGVLAPGVASQQISGKAAQILKDYPKHHTMYGVFKQAADEAFSDSRFPIIRQHQDRIREMIVQAADDAYRNADTLTRRELSQRLMRQFADEGVTGIRYSNGRTVQLDSYSEMVARTQTKNAFNQATWNRLQEYGKDLTLISEHYPCSDLCIDWQARVYSISGDSERFPSLQSAIAGGLFHPMCKHTSAPYSSGQPIERQKVTKRRNEEMYEAQLTQRYNERGIKSWKRREATALTKEERVKAKSKVREWQKRQRDHIESNPFLRRKYDREQI